MRKASTRSFEFIGGHLCLDFANTLGGLRGGATQEHITSYADLVAWSCQAGCVTEEQAQALLDSADAQADQAERALENARDFRETLYRIFAALMKDAQPASTDLALLNTELSKALTGGRLVPVDGEFAWEWPAPLYRLDAMLEPIVRSAAKLLTSPERGLVRECMSPTCSWLFVDRTKNHRRRWCTVTGCGNVAKVRRYRQRHEKLV